MTQNGRTPEDAIDAVADALEYQNAVLTHLAEMWTPGGWSEDAIVSEIARYEDSINDRHGRRFMTDGGAIDNQFEDAERDAADVVGSDMPETPFDPFAGSVAIDLVTRQPLFVHKEVACTLVEYYENEGFDLLSYKMHPYLPVHKTDSVYECVFLPRSAEDAHNIGKTYDYPRGRLMHVPITQAWFDGGDE
jgi:hypothetical protein